MNILFFADYVFEDHPGGSRVVARELARGLTLRGHSVTFLVRSKDGDPGSDTVRDGSRIVRYAVPPGGLRAYVKAGRDACAWLVATETFDIAHTHFAYSASGPLQALPPSVPHLRTFHGAWHDEGYVEDRQNQRTLKDYAVTQARYLLRRRIEQQNLRRSRAALVLSDYSKRELLKLSYPDAQITVVPGGVDTERFHPAALPKSEIRRTLGLPEDRPLLLSIRRLAPRMGLDNLLRALPAVLAARPDILLLIGGQGPERAALEALITRLNLAGNAKILGFIPDDQLVSYYQAADLFVLPTVALEGFGLVTTEALACGLPVLGTDAGATPELLAPLDSRLIVPGATPAALSAGILSFLNDADWPLALTPARLRAYVLENYTWDRHIAQTEHLYTALLTRIQTNSGTITKREHTK